METEGTSTATGDATANGAAGGTQPDADSVEPEAAATAADLGAQLAAANARADEFQQKFLYALADFENYKKRIQRQSDDLAQAFKKRLLSKFLPVLDNLERALGHQESEGLRNGLDATLKGFEAVLASEGVKPLSTKGEPFDPRVAEAIGTQRAEGVANDTVVVEAQRGYALGDDLLRPAQVIVAKND